MSVFLKQVSVFWPGVMWGDMSYYRTQSTAEGSVFGAISLWICYLWIKYLRNCWMDLRQIHTEDVFDPSLGHVWRSKSRSLGTKKNSIFLALPAACVWFMF